MQIPKLIPLGQVCKQFGISRSTLTNWARGFYVRGTQRIVYKNNSDFPEPVNINGRYYYKEEELAAWRKANCGTQPA